MAIKYLIEQRFRDSAPELAARIQALNSTEQLTAALEHATVCQSADELRDHLSSL